MSRKVRASNRTPQRDAAAAAETPPPAPAAHGGPKVAVIACSGLLLLFALLAHVAVASKSPTYDEPLHAVGAWLHLYKGDFRVNPEDPPLWHYWAALPNRALLANPRMDEEMFKVVATDVFLEWRYVVDVLYRTAGNHGKAIVERSQRMMLVIGVVLGGVIAWWSWRLGGLVAALVATAVFALDPNFLGHAALVKNDVSLTLVMLLLTIAVWRAGNRLTVWNALAVCLLCGAGLNVKFSALLLGPMVLALLLIRALMPQPWASPGGELRTRGRRVLAALGVCVAAALVSYVTIWACYGFRYLPTREPKVVLNTRNIIEFLAHNELQEKYPDRKLTPEDFGQWRPGAFTRGVLWFERNHLLPQAWLNGLLYTQQSAVVRKTYLLGEFSMTGWWYYFPFAMLVKSPLALLGATMASAVVAMMVWRRQRLALLRDHGWTIACFAVPVGIYMLSAMTSNLNIGLRHVLPVYPFLFIAIGLAAAWGWRQRPRLVKGAGLLLFVALAVETLAAFPHYVAFFNAAAGGSRGGIRLLGDSNLDWGQDLKLLAQWQQDNPGVPLYLGYFGLADPAYYGVTYKNLPRTYDFGPPFEAPRAPGVVAISATHLQGVYQEGPARALYNRIWKELTPLDVLGGTIYLYNAFDVVLLDAQSPRPINSTLPAP